jgi:hypothetical protein
MVADLKSRLKFPLDKITFLGKLYQIKLCQFKLSLNNLSAGKEI